MDNLEKIIRHLQEFEDIDVWVYALYLGGNEPLNFAKSKSRLISLQKVNVKVNVKGDYNINEINLDKWNLVFNTYGKKGNILKKKINFDSGYCTPLKVFLSEQDAYEAYEKELVEFNKKLDEYQESVINKIIKIKEETLKGLQ